MEPVVRRRPLTDMILTALQPEGTEDLQWRVGDHEKPVEGGWLGDQSTSTFVPYVVLTALPSQAPTGSIEEPEADVHLPYALTAMGDSRQMVEDMADHARGLIRTLLYEKTPQGRKIGKVQVMRYGGVDRLSREPPLYSITDQIQFWTTG